MKTHGKTKQLAEQFGVAVESVRGQALVFRTGSITAVSVDEADKLRGFGGAIKFAETRFDWVKRCYWQSH